MIFQWGYCKEPKSSTYVDFPISFNSCYALVLNIKSDSSANAINITVVTGTQFRWKAGTNWNNDYAYYIAVGY